MVKYREKQLIEWGLVRGLILEQSHAIVFPTLNFVFKVETLLYLKLQLIRLYNIGGLKLLALLSKWDSKQANWKLMTCRTDYSIRFVPKMFSL